MRLLVNDDWYDTISSEGQFEADFRNIVLCHAPSLFPDYYALPFHVRVESEEGAKIPDLVLVDRQYRHWWIVEIELAHHSLHSHVIPQVRVLSQGNYGQRHSDYLTRKYAALDSVAISDMMKGAQPRVLIVVNQSVPGWIRPLEQIDSMIAIVEVFRSNRNRYILRINGELPSPHEPTDISICRLDTALPRLLVIDSPGALQVTSGQRLHIKYEGGLTEWTRLDSADKVWLNPIQRNPLSANRNYLIRKDPDGLLSFGTL